MSENNSEPSSSPELLSFIVTLLFLLITPFFVWAMIGLLRKIEFEGLKVLFFCIGIGAGILLINYTSLLQRLYIFFHELAHASTAIVFSAQIFAFKIGKESGYVQSDKSNVFIRLAPYLLPLDLSCLLTLHYALLIYFRYYHGEHKDFLVFFFLSGMLLTSTSFYNIKLLLKETSDINRSQLMISFTVIVNMYALSSIFLVYLLFQSSPLLDGLSFMRSI